jgi:hypothetical protein
MYTQQQRTAVFRALKGIGKVGELATDMELHRSTLKEQFYPSPLTKINDKVITKAVFYLKEAGVLQDAQLLTELLND